MALIRANILSFKQMFILSVFKHVVLGLFMHSCNQINIKLLEADVSVTVWVVASDDTIHLPYWRGLCCPQVQTSWATCRPQKHNLQLLYVAPKKDNEALSMLLTANKFILFLPDIQQADALDLSSSLCACVCMHECAFMVVCERQGDNCMSALVVLCMYICFVHVRVCACVYEHA